MDALPDACSILQNVILFIILIIDKPCQGEHEQAPNQADVSDSLAEVDAAGLFRFLMRRGGVAGESVPAKPIEIDVAMLDAADLVEAPAGGVIVYRVKPGDRVRKGDQIAYLVDPGAKDPEGVRKEVIATVDGLVMSTRRKKLVALGDYIAMIVGKERLPHRQERLMTD